MLTYNQALEIVKSELSKLNLGSENVPLEDSFGRVLAETIHSDIDLPPFDNSAMDGFAVRFSDRKDWKVKGEIAAGDYNEQSLNVDEALLITTGSKISQETDTVIPKEDIIELGDNIKLKDNVPFKKFMNIRAKGDDLVKGDIAVEKDTFISPKVMAILASCGKSEVQVRKRLKIGILVTGNELIPVDEFPEGDKIRISNSYAMIGAIKEAGHLPVNLGHVIDTEEKMQMKIAEVLKSGIDILITTGGVSVGKYDFLKEVFGNSGVEQKFWRINIKPGKPVYFGVFDNENKIIPVFGLPGNPVSSMVVFYVLIKPALENLYGQQNDLSLVAELQNGFTKNDNKRHFARGVLYSEKGILKVTPNRSQSSGNLVQSGKSNCLFIVNEDTKELLKGDIVECIRI